MKKILIISRVLLFVAMLLPAGFCTAGVVTSSHSSQLAHKGTDGQGGWKIGGQGGWKIGGQGCG